jgi:hypothetical protein
MWRLKGCEFVADRAQRLPPEQPPGCFTVPVLPYRREANLKFEWDSKKAATNVAKHGVSFEEALTVFADPLAHIFDDEDHSIDEQREIIIGHSGGLRVLVVCFSAREEAVRIFSARAATLRERRDYEEHTQP